MMAPILMLGSSWFTDSHSSAYAGSHSSCTLLLVIPTASKAPAQTKGSETSLPVPLHTLRHSYLTPGLTSSMHMRVCITIQHCCLTGMGLSIIPAGLEVASSECHVYVQVIEDQLLASRSISVATQCPAITADRLQHGSTANGSSKGVTVTGRTRCIAQEM